MRRFVSVAVAAKRLEVCGETVRRWLKQGKLAGVRYPSGVWKVEAVALEKIVSTSSTPLDRSNT